MGICSFCNKKERMPFKCKFCGNSFCSDHRLPENHSCVKLSDLKKSGKWMYIRDQKPKRTKPRKRRRIIETPPRSKAFRLKVKINQCKIRIKYFLRDSLQLFSAVGIFLLIFFLFYPSIFNTGKHLAFNFIDNTKEIVVSDSDVSTIVKIKHADNKTLEIEKEVLKYTNEERVKYGLQPLIWNDKLADVARNHSLDMVQRNFFDHDNPDGQGPTGRYIEMWGSVPTKYLAGGYYTEGVAENIGMMPIGWIEDNGRVFDTPSSVASHQVESWMESPGHRENILESTYSQLGVGVARDVSGQYYNTQVFW